MSLDFDGEDFRAYLAYAADIAVRFHQNLRDRPTFHGETPTEIARRFTEDMPSRSTDLRVLLERVERDVFTAATLNVSPRFFGYVMSGGNPVGIVAELLAASLNQNCGKWHVSASATEIERQVVRWIAEFIGFPAGAGGILVSGGSVANLTCLATARKATAPFDVARKGAAGGPPMTVYASVEAHSCIDKSIDLLGIGRDHLRKIPARDDFTMDVGALEWQIAEDRAAGLAPSCVVATAGTVNTGAVDPLDRLADVCAVNGLWLHVDAAYGGPAAGVPGARTLFRGLERAHSVAIDAHKWLYAPFEAGCALVRQPSHLRSTFSVLPEYLRFDSERIDRFDFMEYGFQLSRGFRALKLWLAFQAYGADRLRQAIESNISVMQKLADAIERSEDFELLAPSPLSIVCFRYRTPDPEIHGDEEYLESLNHRLVEAIEADGRVFLTGTSVRGRLALRACTVNHRTEPQDADFLLEVLRDLGAQVHATREGGARRRPGLPRHRLAGKPIDWPGDHPR